MRAYQNNKSGDTREINNLFDDNDFKTIVRRQIMDYITPIIRDQAEVIKKNLEVSREQNILNHKNDEMAKNV